MKKLLAMLLFPLLATSLIACSGSSDISNSQSSYVSSSEAIYHIEDYILIDLTSLSLQEGDKYTLSYTLKQDVNISFKSDNSHISLVKNEDNIIIEAISEGVSHLEVYLQEASQSHLLGKKEVQVDKKAFYLPIPQNLIILKGTGKTATVRAILLDENIVDTPTWSVSDESIISINTQGYIAIITSLARGKTAVTFSLGKYQQTFEVYVTNIRGEL